LKPKAVGWFSSAERWFQTRVSIESYRAYHGGNDTKYYLLFCGSIRDFARISVPSDIQVVFPNQMNSYYLERAAHVGTMGGFPRCLIIDYMLRQNHAAVMCLDGDTETLGRLDDIWGQLIHNDAVVTPHRIYPPPRDGRNPSIEHLGLSGNYNAGFCAFSRSSNSTGFIDWWMRESIDNPEISGHAGRYAEQGWLRFIGDYMDRVHICRDQGVNFAWWRCDRDDMVEYDTTLCRYMVANDQSKCQVPLRLMHYSHIDFNNLDCIARCQNRAAAGKGIKKLFKSYADRVFLTT